MNDDKDGISLTSIAHPGTDIDLNPESLEEITITLPFVSIHEDVLARLVQTAKALTDAVYHDNANNGDILSRETIKAADLLRMELSKWQ